MTELFFNCGLITNGHFLRLGGGAALQTGSEAAPRLWTSLPLLKRRREIKPLPWLQYAFGEVQLRVRQGRAAVFSIQGTDLWCIDQGYFTGRPQVRVYALRDGGVEIRLSRAWFPGTRIPAHLIARVELQNQIWVLKLAFDWGGFQCEVPLAEWLQGGTQAVSTLLGVQEICTLEDPVRITAEDPLRAIFFPSWGFLVEGKTHVMGLGVPLTQAGFALNLLVPEIKGILFDPASRRSLITLGFPGNEPWFSLPLGAGTAEGWRVQGGPCFSVLQVESSEEQTGRIRHLLAAYSLYRDPARRLPCLQFNPGADLLNDQGEAFGLPIQGPWHLRFFDSSAPGAKCAALLGQFANRGSWCHTRRVSLQIGLPPRKGFLLLELGSRLMLGHPIPFSRGIYGLRFPLLATTARPGEGLTAHPMPTPAGTELILSMGVPESIPKPEEALLRLDGSDQAWILLPTESGFSFTRAEDLLALFYHVRNMRLQAQGDTASLVVAGSMAGEVRVFLPPQAIAEEVALEEEDPTKDKIPGVPVPARIAGMSRLAFTVSGTKLPFQSHTLLDWVRKPSEEGSSTLQARLAPMDLPSNGIPVEPSLEVTAIEAPVDLFLSPDPEGQWEGERKAVGNPKRTELWHVRLRNRLGLRPSILAIWTRQVDPFSNGMPTSPSERMDIVKQSHSTRVASRRMMLSSLGAWLDLDGTWDAELENWRQISTMGRDHYVRIIHRGYLLPFGHRVVFIKISERRFRERPLGYKEGRLYQRLLIYVREPIREFPLPADGSHGNNWQIPFQRVEITTRFSPILSPPRNAEGSVLVPGEDVYNPAAFWPKVATASGITDVLFHVRALDRAKQVVEFDMPMLYVRGRKEGKDVPKPEEGFSDYRLLATQAITLGKFPTRLGGEPVAPHRRPLNRQLMAFAQGGIATSVEADSLAFGVRVVDDSASPSPHYFQPQLAEGQVVLPDMRALGQMENPLRVVYAAPYMDRGFGPGNPSQLYLQLVEAAPLGFDSGNRPDKVGGLATPNLKICALSRSHGAMGASPSETQIQSKDLSDLEGGSFNPASYFSDAKLLGGIRLADILDTVGISPSGTETPRWIKESEGEDRIYRLTWTTSHLHSSGFFQTRSGPPATSFGIEVKNRVKASGAADSVVTATLAPFALELGGVIGLEFNSLTFEIPSGSKPRVHVDIKDPDGVIFEGALSFLSKIQKQLGVGNFVDPPYLDVSSEGITCGYSLRIPTIAVGAFALQNLALGAALNVPFTGDPVRARFNISERHDPFLVTVSLFTGGGFFAIVIDPQGCQMLEVSLEFGGSFSLNLGVASGAVYLMAGIYIKYGLDENHVQTSLLSGYVRAGGAVEVLGLITVSVEFYLELSYQGAPEQKAWGEASVTVEIEVLFFSTSVSLTVRREFASGSEDLPFEKMMSLSHWNDFEAAFADEEVMA